MVVGGSFDTFPKLLLRNAAQFGSRPAFRHKDLGIWQTLTWTQVAEIVRAHADVKFVAAQDQEQVDKVLSVSHRVPHLHTIVYDEPRGLRDYDHSRLTAIQDV